MKDLKHKVDCLSCNSTNLLEKDMPREALLSVLITMYSEINEQTIDFLEQHEFKLSRETKKIMKELNDPYGYN